MVENLDYVDLKYRPGKKDVVVEFYVEPNGISLEKACQHVAAESSIGTWTAISTITPEIAKKLKPHVFSMNKNTGEVKIAYPQELFETGNMSNVYGIDMDAVFRGILRLMPKAVKESLIRINGSNFVWPSWKLLEATKISNEN